MASCKAMLWTGLNSRRALEFVETGAAMYAPYTRTLIVEVEGDILTIHPGQYIVKQSNGFICALDKLPSDCEEVTNGNTASNNPDPQSSH